MLKDRFTGLYHTHYREYDPVRNAWLSEDPTGMTDGMNLYGNYFGVNSVDPTGQFIFVVPIAAALKTALIGSAVGASVGAAIGAGIKTYDMYVSGEDFNSKTIGKIGAAALSGAGYGAIGGGAGSFAVAARGLSVISTRAFMLDGAVAGLAEGFVYGYNKTGSVEQALVYSINSGLFGAVLGPIVGKSLMNAGRAWKTIFRKNVRTKYHISDEDITDGRMIDELSDSYKIGMKEKHAELIEYLSKQKISLEDLVRKNKVNDTNLYPVEGEHSDLFTLMAEITAGTEKEVALYIGKDNIVMMSLGTRSRADVPESAIELIAHTHPSGNLKLSNGFNFETGQRTGDVVFFTKYIPDQLDTVIIDPIRNWKRVYIYE